MKLDIRCGILREKYVPLYNVVPGTVEILGTIIYFFGLINLFYSGGITPRHFTAGGKTESDIARFPHLVWYDFKKN